MTPANKHDLLSMLTGVALVVIGVGLWLMLHGCGSAIDGAITASNTAREVGDRAGALLQEACTDRYQVASTTADVQALDKRCIPARNALALYSAAWLALVTAVQAAQIRGTPNEVELIVLGRKMADAASGLSKAMSALEAK